MNMVLLNHGSASLHVVGLVIARPVGPMGMNGNHYYYLMTLIIPKVMNQQPLLNHFNTNLVNHQQLKLEIYGKRIHHQPLGLVGYLAAVGRKKMKMSLSLSKVCR